MINVRDRKHMFNQRKKARQKVISSGKKQGSNKYYLPLSTDKVSWDKVEKIFFSDRKLMSKYFEKEKKANFPTRELLKLLAAGAILGISLVVPTFPMIVAPFIEGEKKYKDNHWRQNIERLKKQKLVKIVEEGDQTKVVITEKGRFRALKYKLCEIEVKKPKVWDRKWRIVIFDIPEKVRGGRDIFRDHLKVMGFYQLQKSVWVYPYPCFDEIEFLRQIYRVGINVTYIVAERIEGVEDLKTHFNI